MKLEKLQPFKEPPPVERESCRACRTFTPEVLVPIGDEAVPMCWLCAHHVVDHERSIQAAPCAECECTPQQIYPRRVFEAPGAMLSVNYSAGEIATQAAACAALRVEHGDVGPMKHPDDWKTGHLYNAATGCIDTHYRGEVIASAPVAPVRKNATRRKSP